ncbi:RidA family protein [Enterococcus gilvus]|uniref:RidA family protein n=1 Tax=Enterococcus gilvus TaxID=160453 RepID=UPI0029110A28|nr:RidA family protein [Enterococcus gilvus]MDU5509095.1 RidA family protein [Enterococcus gilvus]
MDIYSDSIITDSPLLIISGQTPQKDTFIPEDITEQLQIVVGKIASLIDDTGARSENIVKMNVYLTDAAFLEPLRTALVNFYGENKPAMTVVIVAGLVNPKFKVEIDATVALK